MSDPITRLVTLLGLHVLTQPAIVPGWLCEACGRYWRTLDDALTERCVP
jgi:urea transporter